MPVSSSLGFVGTSAPPAPGGCAAPPPPPPPLAVRGLGADAVAVPDGGGRAVPLSDAHARLFVGLSAAFAALVTAYNVVYLATL